MKADTAADILTAYNHYFITKAVTFAIEDCGFPLVNHDSIFSTYEFAFHNQIN